jgi:hypothetical protein
MPPLADELRRLIGALHSQYSDSAWAPPRAPAHRRRLIGGRSGAVNRSALTDGVIHGLDQTDIGRTNCPVWSEPLITIDDPPALNMAGRPVSRRIRAA